MSQTIAQYEESLYYDGLEMGLSRAEALENAKQLIKEATE